MKKRKIFKGMLSVIVGAALLSGCTSAGTGETTEAGKDQAVKTTAAAVAAEAVTTAAPTTAAEEEVTIRILSRFNEKTKQGTIFAEAVKAFEESHPGVTVVSEMQSDESSYNNILSADIASGTMANIFRIQGNANLEQYAEEGLILDLVPFLDADPEWKNGFNQGALNSLGIPGREGLYGVPTEGGIIACYYNEELLKKAGVEAFPETWTQLLEAIEKLKAQEIIPIAIGVQSNFMGGHLHNQIFYKWLGVEATKALGNREMKWTDPEVIQTLQYIQDLIDAGAFDRGAAGFTDDVAFTQFQNGEAAIIITGAWKNGVFGDKEKTPVSDSIKLAHFPSFDEKPELKNNAMSSKAPFMVNGKLEGRELELTIELVKALTSPELAKRYAEEAAYYMPRTDVEIDNAKCSPLFLRTAELSNQIEAMASDVFDFDPLPSMQDRTRNSIASLFVGNATPEEVAAEIQAEIDGAGN